MLVGYGFSSLLIVYLFSKPYHSHVLRSLHPLLVLPGALRLGTAYIQGSKGYEASDQSYPQLEPLYPSLCTQALRSSALTC
jgi:hypothetical protein